MESRITRRDYGIGVGAGDDAVYKVRELAADCAGRASRQSWRTLTLKLRPINLGRTGYWSALIKEWTGI